MLLRHYLEQGTSKSALARQLGVSRDTIHRWIRAGDLDRDLDDEAVRYGPRPPAPTKLDAYKSIIEARLATYPQLSAVRLLDEIRAAGYTGGYTQLKAFVQRVRPAPAPEPIIRFETPAGRQAQVDFARFWFPWGVRYALLVVLGYSRLLWCRFYTRQDMATLVDGLEEAFLYFGGVPQELLFDQMKAVITRDLRLEGGALVRNAEFLRFAHHWGFTARACRPYRAQTKGKVERPVRYLRGNFVYGRTSYMTPISITSGSSGSSASPMCVSMGPRASARASASIARSACSCSRSLRAATRRSSSTGPQPQRPRVGPRVRWSRSRSDPLPRMRASQAVSHEERPALATRPSTPHPRRPADAWRARSARCHSARRRWRHPHGAGGDRAAACGADSVTQ
jgi:transposase